MRLERYMQLTGVKDHQIAARLGVESVTVYRWRMGRTTPSLRLIARLEKVTEGAVRFKDWLQEAAE